MAGESKKRKLDHTPFRRTASSSAEKQVTFAPPPRRPAATVVQNRGIDPKIQHRGIDPKIQQAKDCAVTEAQQDACMANFKIFDSPFGNFLVPVIPTRAELSR
ncbi:SOSS complex subunit C [Heracleum sosnowskyi]|uniref:SOSS complex subunit C n=1 Tax=Heracleum sosnowskyi TaxID=360622 RepID=A0AAD8I2T2_9APIA|nr:SOSS complex subunit C [Heracleum sosnowskyi]